MIYFLLVGGAYFAVFVAEQVDPPAYYVLACGFAYSFIAFCACCAASYIDKPENRKHVVLLLAYAAVNILAAFLNWLMVNDTTYYALRDFYYYETISYSLIIDTADILLLIAGSYNVYHAVVRMFSSNNSSNPHYFFNAKE